MTEYLYVGEETEKLDIGGGYFKKCSPLKYVRSVITYVGTCDRDIQNRICGKNCGIYVTWNLME
jgi:hypothetical protein